MLTELATHALPYAVPSEAHTGLLYVSAADALQCLWWAVLAAVAPWLIGKLMRSGYRQYDALRGLIHAGALIGNLFVLRFMAFVVMALWLVFMGESIPGESQAGAIQPFDWELLPSAP
jgi:hypothetical protein